MLWPIRRPSKPTPSLTLDLATQEPRLRYMVQFASQQTAAEAALRIGRYDFTVEVQPSKREKGQWLVLVEEALPDSKEFLAHRSAIVKAVAGATRGYYHGWEAGPMPDDETAATLQDWYQSGVGAPERARSYA